MKLLTAQEINTLVSGIGLDYAYYQFPEGTEQPTPFICFYISNSNDMGADNSNYCKIRQLVIELYTDNKDYEKEAAVETALTNAGLVYQTEETYLDSERMYMVAYTAQIIFTEVSNNGE